MSTFNNNVKFSSTSSSSSRQFLSNVRKRAPVTTTQESQEKANKSRKYRSNSNAGSLFPSVSNGTQIPSSGNSLTKDKVMSLFNYNGQKRFKTMKLSMRNEKIFDNFIQGQNPKCFDTFTTQPLYNDNTYSVPIDMNLVLTGSSTCQRTGNQIILTSARFLVFVEFPNLLSGSSNSFSDIAMPNCFFRYAIVYIKGRPKRDFGFEDIFADYDYQGNLITGDSYFPPDQQPGGDATNAYATPIAGNSHQGYDEKFKILYECEHSICGVASDSNNGTYVSDFYESSDTRFQFTGNVFEDKTINFLDPDLLSAVNEGDPLVTTFSDGVGPVAPASDITDGGLYFVYGMTYPSDLAVTPVMTFKSRTWFLEPKR